MAPSDDAVSQEFEIPVKFDDLDYDEAGWLLLYEGKPFSGVAIDYYEDGAIYWQSQYLNGLKHGWNREWYPTGILKMENWRLGEAGHGITKHYFPDGKIKSHEELEFGFEVSYIEWDEAGKVIERREIDVSTPEYSTLRKLRLGTN